MSVSPSWSISSVRTSNGSRPLTKVLMRRLVAKVGGAAKIAAAPVTKTTNRARTVVMRFPPSSVGCSFLPQLPAQHLALKLQSRLDRRAPTAVRCRKRNPPARTTEGTMMNRTFSRTILGLLLVAASAIVTGGAAQPPGTSLSGAASSQVVDLPVQCLLEKNIGSCVTCCMDAAIDVPPQACAHFCRLPVPPPPGSEPQP